MQSISTDLKALVWRLDTDLAKGALASAVTKLFPTGFDGGWRFHLGDAASQDLCPHDAFETFDDMYCPGWAHQAAYDITQEECRLYCCGDSSCAGWNYDGRWCSLGNSKTGCVPGQGPGSWKGKGNWTGGVRTVPAPLVEPPAGGPHDVKYDDSAW